MRLEIQGAPHRLLGCLLIALAAALAQNASTAGNGPVEVAVIFSRSPQQQAELNGLLKQQLHQARTPEQFGDRFGIDAGDLGRITNWLESEGLHVTYTARSRSYLICRSPASTAGERFAPPAVPADIQPLILSIQWTPSVGRALYSLDNNLPFSPQTISSTGLARQHLLQQAAAEDLASASASLA